MTNVNLDAVDFEKSNVIFVNGLTLEKVKIKYNWILNSKVKNAIIGENNNGIVWYSGDWVCGTWLNGTWYSGNFYSGIWKNGDFYSYDLNKYDIINEQFIIKRDKPEYSIFHNGIWENGTFYNGTFGVDNSTDWEDFKLFYDNNYPNYRKIKNNIGGSIEYEYKSLPIFMNGVFINGLFNDAIWNNGNHVNGYVLNSKWINGKWFNGTFDGHTWKNGYWYNGQFIKGIWENGEFAQLNKNVISRFGNTNLDTTDNSAICIWKNGVWKSGEWFSGYFEDNGTIIASNKNYLSLWYDGTWKNGHWYGGHFKNGVWENGLWENGIFGNIEISDWTTPQHVIEPDAVNYIRNWSGDTINPETDNRTDSDVSNGLNSYYQLEYMSQIMSTNGISIINDNSVSFSGYSYSFDIDILDDFYSVTSEDNYDLNYFNSVLSNRYIYNFVEYETNDSETIYFESTEVSMDGENYFNLDGVDTTSGISNLKLNLPLKVSLENGCGSGETYWEYSNTSVNSNVDFSVVGIMSENITGLVCFLLEPENLNMNIFNNDVITCSNCELFDNSSSISNTPSNFNGDYEIKAIFYNNISSSNFTWHSVEQDITNRIIIVTRENTTLTRTNMSLNSNATLSLNDSNFLKLIGNYNCFNVSDYVYIQQNKNYVNETYNGVAQVIEKTNNTITVTKKYKQNSNDSGKVVKYMGLYHFRDNNDVVSNGIVFQDFDFFDDIIDDSKTVLGYSIKYNNFVDLDNSYLSPFKNNSIFLPLKNLTLSGFNYTTPIYDNYDYVDYDENLYNNIDYVNIFENGDSVKRSYGDYIYNPIDNSKITYQLGDINDLWGLENLQLYYPESEGFLSDSYNIKKLNTANNFVRFYIDMLISGPISQKYYLSDIYVKIYYDTDETPVWKNGTFKNGFWLNGDFYNGDFLSGLWIKGNFYNGNISYNYR